MKKIIGWWLCKNETLKSKTDYATRALKVAAKSVTSLALGVILRPQNIKKVISFFQNISKIRKNIDLF